MRRAAPTVSASRRLLPSAWYVWTWISRLTPGSRAVRRTNEGDLRAVEGTRVTVHARANYPIRSAAVEFDPGPGGEEPASSNPRLPMEMRDTEAWRDWTLELRSDRQTPQHASYQISFVTAKGQASENPIVHGLEVIPDLAPEVEVLTPNRDRVDVPQDGRQRIEIRGVDPDFGLRTVRLRAAVAGDDLLNETLLEDAEGRIGQVVVEYVFQPAKLGLNVGDEVVYWAAAEDNRRLPGAQTPAANVQRTRNYYLRIVAPTAGSDPDSTPEKPESEPSSPAPQPDAAEQGNEKSQGGAGQGGAGGSAEAASDQAGEGAGSQAAQPSETGESPSTAEQPSGEGTGEGNTHRRAGSRARGLRRGLVVGVSRRQHPADRPCGRPTRGEPGAARAAARRRGF